MPWISVMLGLAYAMQLVALETCDMENTRVNHNTLCLGKERWDRKKQKDEKLHVGYNITYAWVLLPLEHFVAWVVLCLRVVMWHKKADWKKMRRVFTLDLLLKVKVQPKKQKNTYFELKEVFKNSVAEVLMLRTIVFDIKKFINCH